MGTNGSNGLDTRAMLVNLTITSWQARRLDKGASSELAAEKQAQPGTVRAHKRLVEKGTVTYERVQKLATSARTWHYAQSLPWATEGPRILPAANFVAYSQRMRELREEYLADAVPAFVADYPTLLARAPHLLGALYKPEDFPAPERIASAYRFDVRVMPLPASADFRVALSDDTVAEIRQGIEAEVAASVQAGVKDLWRRLYDAVHHMAGKLAEPDAIFRDSLTGNLQELCDLLPRLNLTGDSDLTRLSDDVARKLATVHPQDLRTDKAFRADTAREAESILAAMRPFLGGTP